MNPRSPSVEESRAAKRFIIDPPLRGSFAAAELSVMDIGEKGFQAEHAVALKLGASGKFNISLPDLTEPLRVEGRIVWSRLSKNPNHEGKYLYRSGIRVDTSSETLAQAIERLNTMALAKPDNFSLTRKEKILKEKQNKLLHPQVKLIMQKAQEIPGDQLLLIQQARERLQMHPDEAVKWYNRAKFSLAEAGQQIHHREDVLAVWEYLERTIDLNVISRVFGEKKQ
ncbi:MAG TPA: PilZ domain-containing protein [Thermoanaerobaculia bacterium]|nr:PilZ domain-containing protein [Thermoanaerobaculia bacterium]